MNDFVQKKLTPKIWKRSDHEKWHVMRDVEGEELLFSESFFSILLNKQDGSEQFIPLIKFLVQDPVEKWLIEMKSTTGAIRLIQIYFGRYRTPDQVKIFNLIMKCDTMEGKWVASDLFEATDKQADEFRFGILMYSKPLPNSEKKSDIEKVIS